MTHHHRDGALLGEWKHRTSWHTHEHNHSVLTHTHDYSREEEERDHAHEAHIHDHEAPPSRAAGVSEDRGTRTSFGEDGLAAQCGSSPTR